VNQRQDERVKIPWDLHMALIKLQANEETTFREACILASKLLLPNSEAYHEQINREISKHDKSKLMSSVNRSRKSWMEKGRIEGFNEGYKQGYQKAASIFTVTYPCSVCGEYILMKPGEKHHQAMQQYMKEKNWAHTNCHKTDSHAQ
jgi:hypothetical protein